MDDSRANIKGRGRVKKLTKKRSVRIVGIDPGVATLGWGVIDVTFSPRLKLVSRDYGVITTSKHNVQTARLVELKHDISEVLAEFSPDLVSVERLFFCRNQKTAIAVGEARGVVMLAVGESGADLVEYTPLQVKSVVCGNGRAEKREVQDMVQSVLQLDERPRPDDAADGLALAICAAQERYFDSVSLT
jgi:crossover junction endodeoxyribonuclease RuvC